MAAIIEAERSGSGVDGALELLGEAGFNVLDTGYPDFIEEYFRK